MNSRVRQLNKCNQLQSNASCRKCFTTKERGPGDDCCCQGKSHPDCTSLLQNEQVLSPHGCDAGCISCVNNSTDQGATHPLRRRIHCKIAYRGRAQLRLRAAEEVQ